MREHVEDEIRPCPECDTPMPVEVGERCPNPECDHVVPEPEPYAVTYWR